LWLAARRISSNDAGDNTRGATFHRKLITSSQEMMQNRMGAAAMPSPRCEPVPTAGPTPQSYGVAYLFVDPGNRVVTWRTSNCQRRQTATSNDEVLRRRRLSQREGGWLSEPRSRAQAGIQRLPYVKRRRDSRTTPVAVSPDLVGTMNYKSEGGRGRARHRSSPAASVTTRTTVNVKNGSSRKTSVRGNGQRIAVNMNRWRLPKVYRGSHTKPVHQYEQPAAHDLGEQQRSEQFVSSSRPSPSRTLRLGLPGDRSRDPCTYAPAPPPTARSCLTTSLSSACQARSGCSQNGHPYARLAHDEDTNNEYVFYGQ